MYCLNFAILYLLQGLKLLQLKNPWNHLRWKVCSFLFLVICSHYLLTSVTLNWHGNLTSVQEVEFSRFGEALHNRTPTGRNENIFEWRIFEWRIYNQGHREDLVAQAQKCKMRPSCERSGQKTGECLTLWAHRTSCPLSSPSLQPCIWWGIETANVCDKSVVYQAA